MVYGIPSYKRPECKTVETLMKYGVDPHDIVISTQTTADYEEYKRRHGGYCSVIYAPKDCAAGNRNTILEHVNGVVLLFDDDLRDFKLYDAVERKFKKSDFDLKKKAEEMVNFAKTNGISLFGTSANENAIVRGRRPEIEINVILQGSFFGVMDGSLRFDESYKVIDDYELVLRVLQRGGLVCRFNDIAPIKPTNTTNKGGCKERYDNGELQKTIKRLGAVYPYFKPNKDFTGGMIRL